MYNIYDRSWNSHNLGNDHLYLPQEVTFDMQGRAWLCFDFEKTLAGDQSYSDGGIRYLNYNNQFVGPTNSSELIGGSESDVWSIDICQIDGYDILWVLSSNGVQGYTIFNDELNPISSYSYFTWDIQIGGNNINRCPFRN